MLRCLLLSLTAVLTFAGTTTLRGKLVQREGKPPSLEISAAKQIPLDGDNDTLRVLGDKRLAGADLEVKGRQENGRFIVDPIHTKAIQVHREETELDLREEK
jgi:hypothetical protein